MESLAHLSGVGVIQDVDIRGKSLVRSTKIWMELKNEALQTDNN